MKTDISDTPETDRYGDLKKELRAFHSRDGHICTNPERLAQYARRVKVMDSYAAAHPEADALTMRRRIYDLMKEDFTPVLFPHSPFYFETGGNGGWNATSIGKWLLNHFKDQVVLKPYAEAWNRFKARTRFYDCCGPFFDTKHNTPAVARLLETGFKGIYEETLAVLPECRTPEERKWVETAIAGLEAVRAISESYAKLARQRLSDAKTEEERRFMRMTAENAAVSPWEPPKTFFQALNLCAFAREIPAELEGLQLNSLGRPDAWLIGFYESDLAAGRITRQDAYDLICRFLLMCDSVYDPMTEVDLCISQENEHTLTLGGCDAEGRKVFNELTKMFLQAYRELHTIYPKPFCRYSKSSSSEYLRLIGDDIMAGHGIYALMNDDCVIPAMTAAGHSLEDAREYLCSGCFDLTISACEDNTGGNFFFLPRILDATIRGSAEDEQTYRLKLRRIDSAGSFEEVYRAVMDNVKEILRDMACDQRDYGKFHSELLPVPMHSVCCYDCLKKRKDFSAGGQRYNPHAILLAFFATFLDSLLAIRTLCFEKRICSLGDLLDAVRNNWKDAEELRRQVLAAPHWGDDLQETRELARRIVDELFQTVDGISTNRGGRYQLGISVYREFLREGKTTKATPDGRFDGEELSQSLNPSHFRCREPMTTVLHCLSSLDLKRFAGNSVVNLCLDRENCSSDTVEALIRSFAALDLQQLQLNCMSTKDLEDARIHPEKYPNLVVRICGFSAKFIALSPEWQDEIIGRRKFGAA